MENGDQKGDWRLVRQDTHGIQYFVRGGLSEAFAKKLAEDYNAKGHKQFFWAEEDKPPRPQLQMI